MDESEARALVGCCGLYCGLCSKYQSKAASRCIGCRQGEQHSWCSIWRCCVTKHSLELCSECDEAPRCEIFTRRKVAEWGTAVENLLRIKTDGLAPWLDEQRQRQNLVEELLAHYNEGRSMSLFCKACSLLPVETIKDSIAEAQRMIEQEPAAGTEIKARARIVKSVLKDAAETAEVNLHG